MNETLKIFSILIIYLISGYFIAKYVSKTMINRNRIFRLVVLSFTYALFFGIGIAGNGGNPGFGFPAPNGIALYLMYHIDFMRGFFTGLKLLCVWWIVIFTIMLLKSFIRLKQSKDGKKK
ncbi:MAG: hypothetical protein ACI87N_003382 [Flavobacteriales bacterium]|jgi:hypothetical protein